MGDLKERKVAKIQSSYVEQREKMQQRRKKKKVLLFRRLALFGVVACIFSGIAISTLISQAFAIQEKEVKKQEVEQQLLKLEKKEQLLEEEIIKLNDDEYIAKLARKDYFLSNEGEVIFNLPNKEDRKD